MHTMRKHHSVGVSAAKYTGTVPCSTVVSSYGTYRYRTGTIAALAVFLGHTARVSSTYVYPRSSLNNTS